ncbi:MAG: ABC transporter permease [Planctomycetota bacterium]|nr:ABC transporter permease [Planctomycetota bacterium]
MSPSEDPSSPNLFVRIMDPWGDFWVRTFTLIGGVSYLIADVVGWIWRSFFSKNVRLGKNAVITQIIRIGIRSIGIVMLVCGCIGLILALQMKAPLAELGQVDKIANIVGIAVFRELGPLISAIVLTGFAGASIAAELGTMVVGEEIEALEAHALNPTRFLVVPRVIATVISLIALTVVGDLAAVIASGFITVTFMDIPYEVYKGNTLSQLSLDDFLTGLIKAGVFGIILAAIACYNGLSVTGGAAGVGRATTNTVVQTIVAVIFADLIFTAIFFAVGWA